MDWNTILRAQQTDFIQRLQSSCLLHCKKEGHHSELTIISGERLTQLRNFCWEMVRKYRPNDPRKYFINNMKGKLGEEVVKVFLADFVTDVDYEKRVGGDGKVDFTLSSDPSVGIQVKARHGMIDSVRWSISKEEIEKNSALVCVLILEEVSEAQSEYHLILAGFIPTNMIQASDNKALVSIEELLYCGGLRSYLDSLKSLETINKFPKTEVKNSGFNHTSQANFNQQSQDPYIKQQILNLLFEYFKMGNSCYRQGNYQQALTHYSQVIQLNPNLSEAYISRGCSIYALGNIDRAIEDYNQAISINPIDVAAYFYKGIACLETEKYQEAIDNLTISININPHCAKAYFYRSFAYFYLNKNNIDQALEDLTQCISLNPSDHLAYLRRGWINFEDEYFELSIEDYTQSINIYPESDIAHFARAYSYFYVNEMQNVLEDCNQAIRINCKFVDAYFLRAIVRYNNREYKNSMLDFSRVISLNLKSIKAYFWRAMTLVRLGDYQRAIEDFDQAIKLDNNYALAYENRGIVCYQIGLTRFGISDLEQSADLYKRQGQQEDFTRVIKTLTKIYNK